MNTAVRFLVAALGLAALAGPLPGLAREYRQVTVQEVIGGDAFIARVGDNDQLRVRIAAIDAPDSAQAYGPEATRALTALLQPGRADLDCFKIDRYRRNLCRVTVGGRDVGLALIESGAAWWFQQIAEGQSPAERARYEAAQKQAREAKRGLWAQEAEAPWDWRARQTRKPFDSLINPY